MLVSCPEVSELWADTSTLRCVKHGFIIAQLIVWVSLSIITAAPPEENIFFSLMQMSSQPAFTCSKSTMCETPEQCVKFVQCEDTRATSISFYTSKKPRVFWCFYEGIERDWHCSGVFFVNFEQISHIVMVFPLFNLNKHMSAELLSIWTYFFCYYPFLTLLFY